MDIIIRQVFLPGGREVNILLPEKPCPDITAIDNPLGYYFLLSNGTGYAALTEVFALATLLGKDELIYYPLEFAHMEAYKKEWNPPEYMKLFKGVAIFNFNAIKISARDIAAALEIKTYNKEKQSRRTDFAKEYIDIWKIKRKLTVKSAGKLLIISGYRETFTSMAQSCARLSKCGDDAECNFEAHEHHDWDEENTAKSIGISFHYWHNGEDRQSITD